MHIALKKSRSTSKKEHFDSQKALKRESAKACRFLMISSQNPTKDELVELLKDSENHEAAALHLLVKEEQWEKLGYKDLKSFFTENFNQHYSTGVRKCQHYEMTFALRSNIWDYNNFKPHSLRPIFELQPSTRYKIISELTDGFDKSKFKNVTSTSVKKKAIELGYLNEPVKTSEHEKIKKQFTEYFIKQNKPITLVNFLQEALTENQLKQLIRKLQQVQR